MHTMHTELNIATNNMKSITCLWAWCRGWISYERICIATVIINAFNCLWIRWTYGWQLSFWNRIDRAETWSTCWNFRGQTLKFPTSVRSFIRWKEIKNHKMHIRKMPWSRLQTYNQAMKFIDHDCPETTSKESNFISKGRSPRAESC